MQCYFVQLMINKKFVEFGCGIYEYALFSKNRGFGVE